VLYELQYDVEGAAFTSASLTAQAEALPAAVGDLHPSTTYTFRVRASTANEVSGWQPWGASWACTTRAPPAGAVTNVRAVSTATAGAGEVTVEFDAPAAGPSPWYVVSAGDAPPLNVTQPRAALVGLEPGAVVSATVRTASGATSDPVQLRVPGVTSRFVSVYRISEAQDADDQEVDFLSNHDSGSDAGDVAFVTAVGGSGHFVANYNTSVITQYCVELALQPFADYTSCNKPDVNSSSAARVGVEPNMTYVCACNNKIDRVIGHQDFTKACGLTPIGHHGGSCNCTEQSLARSAAYVGMMPVFLPWMCQGFGSAGNGTCATNIPFGEWYSTPTPGQCPEGAPLGTTSAAGLSCTWRRLSSARILRGFQLLQHGWNATDPGKGNSSIPQFESNLKVWRNAFAAITPRPCGA
jgi:hypothetical protein